MRKLYVVLMASICFLGFSSAAGATTVSMVWSGINTGGGGPVAGISGGSVTLFPSQVATLTLEVAVNVDSRGVSSMFLGFDWDVDLANELNIVSWTELSWSNGMGTRQLDPFIAGITGSQESTGFQGGTIFEFDGTTVGSGPKNTTLTFARLVFVTNHGKVLTDGEDIFTSSEVIGGNAALSTISDAVFIGASVNIIPEPGTMALFGLGLGSLALAGRRRGGK